MLYVFFVCCLATKNFELEEQKVEGVKVIMNVAVGC